MPSQVLQNNECMFSLMKVMPCEMTNTAQEESPPCIPENEGYKEGASQVGMAGLYTEVASATMPLLLESSRENRNLAGCAAVDDKEIWSAKTDEHDQLLQKNRHNSVLC